MIQKPGSIALGAGKFLTLDATPTGLHAEISDTPTQQSAPAMVSFGDVVSVPAPQNAFALVTRAERLRRQKPVPQPRVRLIATTPHEHVQAILPYPHEKYSQRVEQAFAALDAIAQVADAAELNAWQQALVPLASVAQQPGNLFLNATHALLTQAVRRQQTVLQNPNALKPTVLGPKTFANLIEARARQKLGLAVPNSEVHKQYAALPKAVQEVVDNAAKNHRILTPNVDTTVAVEGLLEGDLWAYWNSHYATWLEAGVEMVLDPTINAYLAVEHLSHGRMNEDELSGEFTSDQMASWRQVQSGERISPTKIPDFLPTPTRFAASGELLANIVLKSNGALTYYEKFLETLDDAESFSPVSVRTGVAADIATWPAPMQKIATQLRELHSHDERKAALPYLLLQGVLFSHGEGDGHSQDGLGMDIRRVRRALAHDPWLLRFVVELWPDQRDSTTAAAALFLAPGQNQALRHAQRYAPGLENTVALPHRLLPKAVQDVVNQTPNKPLAHVNFIGVQHLLADNAATLMSLVDLGLNPKNAALLGVPYSTHEAAAQLLRTKGFDVDTRERRGIGYAEWREVQACELVQKALGLHAQNGKPIVAMDDGGYITRVLEKYFPIQRHLFVVVEQTTRGITEALARPLPCDVVNVARSPAKQLELPGIAESLTDAVVQRLARYSGEALGPAQHAELIGDVWIKKRVLNEPPTAQKTVNKKALVIGYGWIGQVVAKAMRDQGYEVTACDPSPEARAKALEDGFVAVSDPEPAMHEVGYIPGCSGTRSLTSAQLNSLRNGQVVFSCSSACVEFEAQEESHFHEDLVVHNGKTSYVMLSGGMPINFTGEAEVGPTSTIQYTRAAMVHGILQAAERFASKKANVQPQLVDLEASRAEAIAASAH